ncbi:glycosyltransferase [Geobacillus stearothermophilus]|uniref:glycosyltransferase family 2 protein n=1 Tax=Geobacillus stearothermophilus TaxID=1422 RepID=UPI0005190624|nr:glycosyltransferase [Geobacillus stearothermophilus]MED3777041.1 glycosyltransferase [Geobacillus stearothermophilus]MED4333137.1 glycosyltransferase [Geobacillus stearothermophilus]MED4832796.1 glycosyltransferase [Geobacillus stearothermophilus]MED4961494.1 glycosyltransferase [Geobacillus stearothermophilus]MED4978580.1 glycosyltransferase [Geobacillus stearothermophilus]
MIVEAWRSFLWVAGHIVLIYMVIVLLFYAFLLVVSFIHLRRIHRLDDWEPYEELLDASYAKPVSILVPAYNEEAVIVGSVRSLLAIEYPEYEVIVINDGSTDKTLERLIEHFHLQLVYRVIRHQLDAKEIKAVYQSLNYPHLFVLDKENGGKADALNAGINASRYPYICTIDGDSVLERRAFLKVMKPMLESDGEIIASGGSVHIANGCRIERGEIVKVGLSRRPLVIMQTIEYLRAFLLGRLGLSRHNLLLIVSGAFGVFFKPWVIEAGGYADTAGEDMELVVRLHRLAREKNEEKKIIYIPDPVCWTEAPETYGDLRRQRRRWHRGLLESLWMHRSMLFNPKYGSIGLLSLPYFWFIELLGPIVELMGYIVVVFSLFLGNLYVEFALLLLTVSVLYGSLLSAVAVLLEEWTERKFPSISDLVKLFFFALTETFWYRPLTAWWRCEGVIDAIRRKKQWGSIKRKGVSA